MLNKFLFIQIGGKLRSRGRRRQAFAAISISSDDNVQFLREIIYQLLKKINPS
jgi:hypothetical protein